MTGYRSNQLHSNDGAGLLYAVHRNQDSILAEAEDHTSRTDQEDSLRRDGF